MSQITDKQALALSVRAHQYRLILLAAVAALAVAVALAVALSEDSTPATPTPASQSVDGAGYDGASTGHPRLGSASPGVGAASDVRPNKLGQRP
jgi:hypothetical protein